MEEFVLQDMVLLSLAAIGLLYVLHLVYLVVPWCYNYFLLPPTCQRPQEVWGVGGDYGIHGWHWTCNGCPVCTKENQRRHCGPISSEAGGGRHGAHKQVQCSAKISDATSDIQVGILVNNVGVSYPYARFLHEVDADLERSLLQLNCETTTKMIHLPNQPLNQYYGHIA